MAFGYFVLGYVGSEQGRLSLFSFSVQKVANHGQAAPNERLRTLSYLRGGIQLNDVVGMLKLREVEARRKRKKTTDMARLITTNRGV